MTADEPRNALRAHDPDWLTALPRARESDKRAWATLCCLIAQRRPDGVAPVVLETAEGDWIRCPLKYEAAIELCLRHLHNQHTPLGGESCTIGALLANRAAEALKLPGRWVPLPDGSVEERAGDPAPDDAPPETPDASALPDYSESPRCCRSPWAPCGSRGERPSDSRGGVGVVMGPTPRQRGATSSSVCPCSPRGGRGGRAALRSAWEPAPRRGGCSGCSRGSGRRPRR